MLGDDDDPPDLFGYNLYGGEPPHQRHSKTSRAAARKIRTKIGPMHNQILDWMKAHPHGGIDEVVGQLLDMAPNTYRPRRIELTQMGRLVDSGRLGLTRARRHAVIWILAP